MPKRQGGNNQGGKENSGGKSPGDKTVAAANRVPKNTIKEVEIISIHFQPEKKDALMFDFIFFLT